MDERTQQHGSGTNGVAGPASEHAASEHADSERAASEQAGPTARAQTSQAHAGAHAGEQAERIASDGDDVRRRIHDLVMSLASGEAMTLDELRGGLSPIVEGVIAGVRGRGDAERGRTLAAVADGLTDAATRVAQATSLSLREAQSRGQRFAESDVASVASDLRGIRDVLLQQGERLSSSVIENSSGQARDVVEHVTRTMRSALGPIDEAIAAASRHPASLGGESVGAATKTVGRAVGVLGQAITGLLGGLRDGLDGQDDRPKRG